MYQYCVCEMKEWNLDKIMNIQYKIKQFGRWSHSPYDSLGELNLGLDPNF